MSSTIGGDDPAHDFSPTDKDKLEKDLRQGGEALRKKAKHKEGQKKIEQQRFLVPNQKGLTNSGR